MTEPVARRFTRRTVGVLGAVAIVALAIVVGVVAFLPRGDADVARLKAKPFGGATVDAAVSILARTGVGTYETPESAQPIKPVAAPVSPLVLLSDQVRAMALEAQVGGGIPGDEIDALIEIDEGLAPPSYVLAGYVNAADTPASRLAREIMGDQDWQEAPHLTFPQIVLVLFTADVVHARMTEAEASTPLSDGLRSLNRPLAAIGPVPVPHAAAPNQGSGPCSAVQNFIDNALKRVFDALKLGESGGIGGFFASIWNWVVGALETVISGLIKAIGQPVLDLIAKIAAVVGTVSLIVSAIRPWAVSIRHEPITTEKGTNDRPPDHGALIARVDTGGMTDWPAWIKDCAAVAGQPLPNLKPEGTPVQWADLYQSPLDLAARDSQEAMLNAAAEARLDYTTLIDYIDQPYDIYAGMIWTKVTLERQELKQLADIAQTQLLSLLPGFVVQAIYAPLLKPEIDKVIASLGKLITVSAWGQGIVYFHIKRPTPPPTSPPPTATPRPVTPKPPVPTAPPGGGGTQPEGPGCEFTCPGSNGDPHVVTVDGYKYDFQAAGEFTLLRSADGLLELQARQEPYRQISSVSINSAVAVGYDGARVAVYANGSELTVRINGSAIDLSGELAAGQLQVRPTSDGVEIEAPDGSLVWVQGLERWGLYVTLDPSDELETSGAGLLGPANGELLPRLPDGSQVDAETDYRGALYGPFADGWAVTDANTLFDYEPGGGPQSFRDPAFPDPNTPLNFDELTPEQQQSGLATCAAVQNLILREQCAFDVVTTGDPSFVELYLETNELHDRRGGDACGLLTNEEIQGITGLPVVERAAGTDPAELPTVVTTLGNAGCTWSVENGEGLIDPTTGQPATFDVKLDLFSPGGRAAFDEDQILYDAFHYQDVEELAGRVDHAVTGSGAFEPIVAVRGDTRIVLDYINPLLFDSAQIRQQRVQLISLILDRL